MPRHARGTNADAVTGVESNSRLTAVLAVILLATLFLEGLTIVAVGTHLSWHVFLGVLLIPVTLVKVASTSWRFARYYLGDPSYTAKGPPKLLLRVLGPVVVLLSLEVLLSGLLLVIGTPVSMRSQLLFLHKAGFVLWFGVMAIHVLGHLGDTAREAPLDFRRYTRHAVEGANVRQWIVAGALVTGLLLALVVTPHAAHWFANPPTQPNH
jgi:hypothetical protein